MYIRRNAAVKYCLALVFGAVLYAEFLVYYIQPLFWLNLKCTDVKGCTKILFIADPQIQGEMAVPPPLSYLFNWDSDRYLRMTFTRVAHYFQPDVMVFLGDLMDEGSIADEDQYAHYIMRLSDIFEQRPYPLHKVWIPGDNDIGGENEPIKWDKVKTFHRVFAQPPVMALKGISFYRVNAITNAYPKPNGNWTDDNFKIAISHYPLMVRHAIFKEISKRVDPHIYFCAHDHESKYTSQKKPFEGPLQRNKMHQFYGREILDIRFDTDEVFEIYVPTCSYRMGTSKIGYGAAVVDRPDADTNNSKIKLRYTVFWSSQRFPYLFIYAGILVLALVYTTAYFLKLCFKYYCQSVSKLPVYRRHNTSPQKL